MITRVPRITTAPTTAAINTILSAIEVELNRRPVMVNGAILVSPEQPLTLVSPGGLLYRVSVDDSGAVTTTAQANPRVS